MNKIEFCEDFVHLNRKPIRFAGREYLRAVYNTDARNVVVRASRQVEKSTYLVNTILYEAATHPGIAILFVCPRIEQARLFSGLRLLPALEQSPLLRRNLLGKRMRKPQVMNIRFANDSVLFVRAAYHSADAARGISADILAADEFQDIAGGDLPVLQETLSHSKIARTILTGTPKLIDNHLQTMFQMSTGNEWTISCSGCGKGVILDERCLGPSSLMCPDCQTPIDARCGRWVARNPGAEWGEGFWVNHLMVPWLNLDEVLDRQRTYDPARFKNECLGLPTVLGDHIVTRAELEECCTQLPMANSLQGVPPAGRQELFAGIDWGGGGKSRTVLVIGYMRSDYVFHVCRLERFASQEEPDRILREVAARCAQFGVKHVGADGGGNGHVYNRLLVDKLRHREGLYAILYSMTGHEPQQDGMLWKWTVNRSATIGAVFSRIKKRMVLFPRVEDCGSFLDEFACEVAEYDDHYRSIRYTHPENMSDDALHATNYALLLAIRGFRGAHRI